MNIVREITLLRQAVKRLKPSPGKGIAIEETPAGTRISLLESSAGSGGSSAWHGMFELVDASAEIEGEVVYQVKVINGADEESELCGIAHINRQPFEVAVAILAVADTYTAEAHCYIYLKFTPPVEGETPVSATVVVSQEALLQESTDTVVWHLIGQVWVEDGMLRIEQDHIPGNAYIEWYGPCLGLLEESDD